MGDCAQLNGVQPSSVENTFTQFPTIDNSFSVNVTNKTIDEPNIMDSPSSPLMDEVTPVDPGPSKILTASLPNKGDNDGDGSPKLHRYGSDIINRAENDHSNNGGQNRGTRPCVTSVDMCADSPTSPPSQNVDEFSPSSPCITSRNDCSDPASPTPDVTSMEHHNSRDRSSVYHVDAVDSTEELSSSGRCSDVANTTELCDVEGRKKTPTPPPPPLPPHHYNGNTLAKSPSSNDIPPMSPCTPPLPPSSPPPPPPPPATPPPPLPDSSPPLSPLAAKSQVTSCNLGNLLVQSLKKSKSTFKNNNYHSQDSYEDSQEFCQDSQDFICQGTDLNAMANARSSSSSPINFSADKMQSLITKFKENQSSVSCQNNNQQSISKSDIASEDSNSEFDLKCDVPKNFASFMDNNVSSPLSPDRIFCPPTFSSFLPSGNDLFSGGAAGVFGDAGSRRGDDSSTSDDSSQASSYSSSSSLSDDDTLHMGDDNKKRKKKLCRSSRSFLKPPDKNRRRRSSTIAKKLKKSKAGDRRYRRVDSRALTPSPQPEVAIECPPSPSPQFGSSPMSSRTPSPAVVPSTSLPLHKLGENRRRSDAGSDCSASSEQYLIQTGNKLAMNDTNTMWRRPSGDNEDILGGTSIVNNGSAASQLFSTNSIYSTRHPLPLPGSSLTINTSIPPPPLNTNVPPPSLPPRLSTTNHLYSGATGFQQQPLAASDFLLQQRVNNSDILSPTGSCRGDIMSPTTAIPLNHRVDILSPSSVRGGSGDVLLSPNGPNRDLMLGSINRTSIDSIMSPAPSSGRGDILSPPPNSPRYNSSSIMSPAHSSSYNTSIAFGGKGFNNIPDTSSGRYSNNSCSSSANHHSASSHGGHHHHHHRSNSSSRSLSGSRRARSPMDLPVPKWNIDPIYLKPKVLPNSCRTPPYQKDRPGRTPPYQRENIHQQPSLPPPAPKEKEIIILPVEPRRVTIPPSAEKLRRYSEDKEKVHDRDREKRLSIESMDSPRSRSFDEPAFLMNKVLNNGGTIERSNSVNSQCSTKLGSEPDSNSAAATPMEIDHPTSLADSKTSDSVSSSPTTITATSYPVISKGAQSNTLMESPSSGPKLDFHTEVLGELGEFAESGDTSIYTGPELEILEEKVPAISRIKEEEMNLLSPTKSRSKLPTSARRGEKNSAPIAVSSCVLRKDDDSADLVQTLAQSVAVACIDTLINDKDINLKSVLTDVTGDNPFIFPINGKTECIDKSILNAAIKPEIKSDGSDVKHTIKVSDSIKNELKSEGDCTETGTTKKKSCSENKCVDSSSMKDVKVKDEHHSNSRNKATDKSDHHSSSSSSRKHHHKDSTSTNSSSNKKYECSRCYKRSKIKRYNIGVQCKRDKTDAPNVSSNSSSVDSISKTASTASSSVVTNTSISNTSDTNATIASVAYGCKHKAIPRPITVAGLTAASEDSATSGVPPYLMDMARYKYGSLMHVETYPNGNATVCHMYEDEMTHLTPEEREEAAREFLEVSQALHIFYFCAANYFDLWTYSECIYFLCGNGVKAALGNRGMTVEAAR